MGNLLDNLKERGATAQEIETWKQFAKDFHEKLICECHGTPESCYYRYVKIDGKYYERDTEYFDVNEFCHDCGVENVKGNTHHTGCDMELCPGCGGQLAFDDQHDMIEVFVTLPKVAKLTPAKYDYKFMQEQTEKIREWQIEKYGKPIGEETTEE